MSTSNTTTQGVSDSLLASSTFTRLTTPPNVAWPTVTLFLLSYLSYLGATGLAVTGYIPGWVAMVVNTIAAYWLFTVFHDAAHRSAGKSQSLNDWLGRAGILVFFPFPIFKAFRFIHMQHHRFANDQHGKDPDAYTGNGPTWLLPLRWATVDLYYYVFYFKHLSSRPGSEKRELAMVVVFGLVLFGGLLLAGAGEALLWYWLIPGRVAAFFLALSFDYLPHHPRNSTQQENPWQATNNRMGLEWLLTPVLMWQNYHLVHHLYPRAPFYRYLRIWRTGKPAFERHEPLLVDLLGRELPRTPPSSS
ncbi:MAG: hypothetical protein EA349_05185 [Halomonadaceae bacterium]|nr:MAG: hypothetical protein EA349_05185 [Halomonadaceae bacterium]